MSKQPTIHRRQFLLFTLGITGSLVAGSKLSGAAVGWLAPENLLHSKLTGLFMHQESAQAIGRAYLQSHPQAADARTLESQIAQSLASDRKQLIAADSRSLSELLAERIRQDFEAEQIVKVQGWILSVTEARLCALTVLA
jgi:hypothetical protein